MAPPSPHCSEPPLVALRLPDPDPVRWLLPVADLTVESQQPWMLKILDAERAVAQRPWPRLLSGSVDLMLLDGEWPAPAAPAADGRCRWSFADCAGSLAPGGSGEVRLDVRGLSVLYAGAGSAAMLRQAGLLSGPTMPTRCSPPRRPGLRGVARFLLTPPRPKAGQPARKKIASTTDTTAATIANGASGSRADRLRIAMSTGRIPRNTTCTNRARTT